MAEPHSGTAPGASRLLPTMLERRVRRRTVATRVLVSYLIVMLAFTIAAGWSVLTQRRAAEAAHLMRSGYLPLSLALRDLVAKQDTWNSQLNDVTSALNPADKSVWFDTALRIGRPKMFGEVRAAISRAFLAPPAPAESVGKELLRETSEIESFLSEDTEQISKVFEALDAGEAARAEEVRDELVRRGSEGKKRLSMLEQRIQRKLDELLDESRARERAAIRMLIGLASLALVVGAIMAVYAGSVLKPLRTVTERARAVALGDLTPRAVSAATDEIGELAATFEGMVAAIGEARERIVAAERLATIGKMAAHVTHEIRNPLSSIALNLELLSDELHVNDGEARTLLSAISREVDRLHGLSEQYLSVARHRPPRLTPEDVGEIVREACDFMRRDLERRGVDLSVEVSPDLPLVRVDEGQLKQSLFNLLRNAQEAMPAGGRLVVSVSTSGRSVVIAVDDEGEGIDESVRRRLFEPFFTTKSHGTGLGLAVTVQMVEAHGGRIACESREGRGTRMRIELPAMEATGALKEAKPA